LPGRSWGLSRPVLAWPPIDPQGVLPGTQPEDPWPARKDREGSVPCRPAPRGDDRPTDAPCPGPTETDLARVHENCGPCRHCATADSRLALDLHRTDFAWLLGLVAALRALRCGCSPPSWASLLPTAHGTAAHEASPRRAVRHNEAAIHGRLRARPHHHGQWNSVHREDLQEVVPTLAHPATLGAVGKYGSAAILMADPLAEERVRGGS
jgi:hypothetical protein